jgi:S-adenosylmethionine:tRNA ribosyltransferase-isomerase
LKLSDFDYDLPEELIAQEPLAVRDQARLLVIDRKTHAITHDHFCNLDQHLPSSAQIVINNSRVIPARLLGFKERGAGQVEVFLLKDSGDGQTFEALLRPLKRIRQGEVIRFADSELKAEVIDRQNRIVRFNVNTVYRHLDQTGHIPLPPYIKRSDTQKDHQDYQTVYAKEPGSVAAPTAGLHFTNELIQNLTVKGHSFHPITLHINYATFKPVEVEDITHHQMHQEFYQMSPQSWVHLSEARRNGCPVAAVGTTSTRVLEALSLQPDEQRSFSGQTNLFIYPGYRFKMVDLLITNFHLPRSTLLMLVYAFGGTELMKRAYQAAIQEKYRFYSYGDAMMIL